MEVVNDCSALLSNCEVYALLNDIKVGRGYRKPGKNQQNLSTIVYETSQYLTGQPCTVQNGETIAAFRKAVEPFRLTKAEQLELLNTRPTSAVELQLLIEESEERFSEDDMERLIEIVVNVLPAPTYPMECSEQSTAAGV